jgi:hypothetical protein
LAEKANRGAAGPRAAIRQGYQEKGSSPGVDPAAVAAYYRAKGYVVRDGARVAGPSGTEHKVPLLAEGPLGSLAVFFGDFGGVDGPEMGGARKVAREVGATPVLAADTFSNQDRQLAARLGVVLVDAATLGGEGGPVASSGAGSSAPLGLRADTGRAWPGLAPIPTRRAKESEPEPHPWPASGRVGGRDGPATRAVDVDEILANPSGGAPARPDPLATLPGQEPDAPTPASATDAGPGQEGDGDGLWKRPRDRQAPAAQRPRTPASQRFAWLGADVPPASPPGATALAVEYDDAVPAPAAGDEADDERLGESIELLPTLEEARRQAARDQLMRRLFWILFAAVVLYLIALWWF